MDLLQQARRELLHHQAESSFKGKHFRAALKKYEELLKTALKGGDEREVAFYEEKVGDCYEKLDHESHEDRVKDHEKAGEYYIRCADRYRVLGDHEKAGEVYEKGAKTFEELDNFKRAGEFYEKSGIMFEDVGDFFNASYAYHAAAEYYEKDGEHGSAAQMYEKSAVVDLKIKDKASAGLSFKKAAQNYERAGRWKDAIDGYAGAVEIDTLNRQYLEVADTYERMAEAYYELDDQKNAIYYHLKAADLRAANDNQAKAAASYREVGGVYQNGGEVDNAIGYYLKSAETYYGIDSVAQAAASYSQAAAAYALKGDLKTAGDRYVDAAKASELAKNDGVTRDAYMKAADAYVKAAEKSGGGDAADLMGKAAEAYGEIGLHEKSAETYRRRAELLDKAGDNEGSEEAFREAAEAYVEGGMLWDAAESYVDHGDYGRAAELYDRHAAAKEEEKDLYGAGLAYMEAGNCYRRLHDHPMMKNRLDKAVSYFSKYAAAGDNKVLLGDAHRKIGECYKTLGDFNNALQHFSKAEGIYGEAGEEGRVKVTSAFRVSVEAVKALDRGDYNAAEKLVSESEKLFNEAIEGGDWKREYVRILGENVDEGRAMVNKIKLKPDVTLDMDQRTVTFSGVPVVLNLKLSNNGSYTMKGITFLEHLPEEMELLKLPDDVPELEPGGERKASVELTASRTGEYRIKPIEVYYEDQKGHKYVKASSEVSVEVIERPAADFKNYMKAVESYRRYGESQERNGNWFQAGDGYRQMAETYGKFRTDEQLEKHYRKAIDCYTRYIGAGREVEDETTVKRLGDAHWFIGQALDAIGDPAGAAQHYQESIPYYRRSRMDDRVNRSAGYRLKAEGTKMLKEGDAGGSEKLEEALKYLNEAVKSGGFSGRELEVLEGGAAEARTMLDTGAPDEEKPDEQARGGEATGAVEEKAPAGDTPSVTLDFGDTLDVKVGSEVGVDGLVVNDGGVDVTGVRFLGNTTDDFEVSEAPEEIKSLPAGGERTVKVKFKSSREGSYPAKLVELFYRDPDGKRYFKSSEPVNVKAGAGN